MAYNPGDFSFFPEEYERAQHADFYQAITKAEAWDLIKQDPGEGGFMFSTTWNGDHIHKHMTMLGDHSGASYGIGMRRMQYIAKHGWEAFVAVMLSTA